MTNFISTLASDILGLLMMIVLLFSRGWKIQTKRSESKILFVMAISVILGCIANSLSAFVDGEPGTIMFVINYICCFFLFSLNIIISPCYIIIILVHINDKLSRFQLWLIVTACFTEGLLLLVNFFIPLVFDIDGSNRYHRGPLFWVYVVTELALLMYGLLVYVKVRRSGRLLQFFPAWIFVVPIAAGILFQSLLLGVSIVWPCVGVALCGITICIQKESIYLDKLTGVYNRFYLEEIKDSLKKQRNGRFGAMMLDLNDFKHINDDFSHADGDNALIAFADILNKVVGNEGVVIRYAGDEFVVLIRSDSMELLRNYKELIIKEIEAYNEVSQKPYKLSASIGIDISDLNNDNISGFIHEIDKLMYADKAEYYKTHDRRGNS